MLATAMTGTPSTVKGLCQSNYLKVRGHIYHSLLHSTAISTVAKAAVEIRKI